MFKNLIALFIILFFDYSNSSSRWSGQISGTSSMTSPGRNVERTLETNKETPINKCRGTTQKRKAGRYDQLILAQHSPILSYYEYQNVWPATNLTVHNCGLTVGACKSLLTPGRWVLHGLWPFKISGSTPTFCTEGLPDYSDSLINSTLLTRLDEEWPDYLKCRRLGSIWNYEWNKHGSCASDQKCMDTVPKYFDKSLEFLEKYNVGNILNNCKILPGRDYKLEKITSCITKDVKKAFRIRCFTDENSKTKEQYLYEVRFCIKKETLFLDDCRRDVIIACDSTKLITYAKLKEVRL